MGRNNHDYKIKDKNLTKSKKNAKLNKSIAFTLAGMAAIGAGAMAGGQAQEAKAMMGRVGSVAGKVTGSASTALRTSFGKAKTGPINKGLQTSRYMNGAPGSINSGRIGSNGTQFGGIGKSNFNNGIKIPSKTQTGGTISQQVQSKGITSLGAPSTATSGGGILKNGANNSAGKTGGGKTVTFKSEASINLGGNKTSNTNASTSTGKNQLSTSGKLTSNQTNKFEGGTTTNLTPKAGSEKLYSQQNNTGDKVITTEGFYRK